MFARGLRVASAARVGLRWRSNSARAGGNVVPKHAIALGGLGLIPFLWYGAQHAPWNDKASGAKDGTGAPWGDAVISRWQSHLPLPGALEWLKAGSQAAVRERFLTYGAVILSFLGGVHWGAAAVNPAAWGRPQMALSVVPSLIGWGALALGRDEKHRLAGTAPHSLLSLGFLAQYFVDEAAATRQPTPAISPWYPTLRAPLTAIVTICVVGAAQLARERSIADSFASATRGRGE